MKDHVYQETKKEKKVDPIGRLALNKDFKEGDTGARWKNICIYTLKREVAGLLRMEGEMKETDNRKAQRGNSDWSMGWVQTTAYSTLWRVLLPFFSESL